MIDKSRWRILFAHSCNDNLNLGVLECLVLIEGGGCRALDFVLCHAGNCDIVTIKSVLDKEFFNTLCACNGNLLLGLYVDGIRLDVTFNLEGQVGMTLEHLYVVEQRGVRLRQQFGIVVKIDVGDGEYRALDSLVEVETQEGVILEDIGVEFLEDGEVAISLGVKRIVEARDELDFAAAEVGVFHYGTVASVLLLDKEVDIDVAFEGWVVEDHKRFEGFDLDGDLDGVAHAVSVFVVEDDVVDFTLAYGDGFKKFLPIVRTNEITCSVVVHAECGLCHAFAAGFVFDLALGIARCCSCDACGVFD